jgi:uncharacterized membrane protein YraQ (UPF0718 family)
MLWETLWALVLGFAGSAALQAFVRREDMVRHFGRPDLRSVGSATFLGAVSSSCSYAAAAAARSAFSKGAHLVPTLAFMFAATNLVLELGCVLWILMGWRFVLAEFVGAFVLIAIMWLLVALVWSRKLEEAARSRVNAEDDGGDCCHGHHHPEEETPARLARVADAFFMDVGMMWKEILIGFFLAALFMALVPPGALQVLFLHGGPPALRLVENSVMGVLIAALSCVCSVGNVPLAAALWSGGISFGGVISFVYADLVILPLLFLYRKYYGGRAAAVIVAILGASMILAGLAVDLLFQLFGLVPQGARPPSPVQMAHFAWNYTSWLDLLALAVMAALAAVRVRSSAPAKPHAAVLTHHSHP